MPMTWERVLNVLIFDDLRQRFQFNPLGSSFGQALIQVHHPVNDDVLIPLQRDHAVPLAKPLQGCLGFLDFGLELGELLLEELPRLFGELEAGFQTHADKVGRRVRQPALGTGVDRWW